MGGTVSVHAGCNFDGQSSGQLQVGDYNTLNIAFGMGIGDNSIQSIRVQKGWKVTVYEHPNFQGASLDLTQDTNLCGGIGKWTTTFPGTNNAVHKNISSFKVSRINGFENVDEPSSDSETSFENFTDFSNNYYLLILAIVLLIAFLNRERLMKMIKA